MLFLLFALASSLTLNEQWKEFRTTFNRVYTSTDEEALRLNIFKSNMAWATQLNSDTRDGAEYGVTRFADLTPEEFQAKFTGYRVSNISESVGALKKWNGDCFACKQYPETKGPIPDAVDWVTKGAVVGVKDQAQCGSCWAFSTVGGIEGAWHMAGNDLTSLSEEEIVSCDTGGTDQGCQGGEMTSAYPWVIKNGGLNSEKAYPYAAGSGDAPKCNKKKENVTVAHIDDAFYISNKRDTNETAVMEAVARVGPLSIGINAGHLQVYRRGILNPWICLPKLDHGVLMVGFGIDDGKDYWKIKNSWGESWGEDGYFRIIRGKNKCGCVDDVSVGYTAPSKMKL